MVSPTKILSNYPRMVNNINLTSFLGGGTFWFQTKNLLRLRENKQDHITVHHDRMIFLNPFQPGKPPNHGWNVWFNGTWINPIMVVCFFNQEPDITSCFEASSHNPWGPAENMNPSKMSLGKCFDWTIEEGERDAIEKKPPLPGSSTASLPLKMYGLSPPERRFHLPTIEFPGVYTFKNSKMTIDKKKHP